MTFSAPSLRLLLVAAVGLTSVAGCRKAPIESYRIPHEEPKPAVASSAPGAPSADMMSQPVPAASGAPDIHWAVPAEWQTQPDQTGMRKGSFVVKDRGGHEATIAVTVFPGDVGGDLANINRWLGQIQLPPITEADLANVIKEVPLRAGVFKRVDLVGGEPPADPNHDHRVRILGAWLKQDTRTWFFKMTGDSTLVGNQTPAFDAFIASVHFTESAPASAPAAPATVATGPLTWTAPAGWQPKDLGPMRKASHTVAGDADFSVISFPGDAGGDLANVNRWRGQVTLAPWTEAEFADAREILAVGALNFTIVDFAGGGTRIIAAILPHDGESYFFKLMGPDAAVAGAKPEFIAFLKSVTTR